MIVARGDLGVDPVDREARRVVVDRLQDRLLGGLDQRGIARVHFEAAVAQDRDRDRVAVGVVQADLAVVVAVPQRVPTLGRGLVVADPVAAIPDPPRVDRVGNGVIPPEVVVRTGVRIDRPDVGLHVGDQFVLQRLEQVLLDEAAQVPRRRHEHVGTHLPVDDLLDALLQVVEGGDVDRNAELVFELVDHRLPDVIGPVVQDQRARFDRCVGRDRVLTQGERDRVLERGDRDLTRAAHAGGARLRARGQDRGQARHGDRRAARAGQELPAGQVLAGHLFLLCWSGALRFDPRFKRRCAEYHRSTSLCKVGAASPVVARPFGLSYSVVRPSRAAGFSDRPHRCRALLSRC